jgi:hypothetical protein
LKPRPGSTGRRTAYTFNYDGSQLNGDLLDIGASYNANATTGTVETLYNAALPAPAVIFTIPLVRLELPLANNPAGATEGGTTFDPTDSWYYIAPTSQANDGATAVLASTAARRRRSCSTSPPATIR